MTYRLLVVDSWYQIIIVDEQIFLKLNNFQLNLNWWTITSISFSYF